MAMAEFKIFIKMLILLLGTITLFIKPTSVPCTSKVECIERERQALLKFKQDGHVRGGYYDLSSWGSGESERECCKWPGVECSNITGHVIRLDLASYFNGGKINSALLELKHLEYLDLSGNSLRVNNLDWLPHLSSLRHLDLSYNDLHETKNWLQQISKLSFLEELYLSKCQLPDTLPAFDIFVNSSILSSLRILGLAYNNLSFFTTLGSLFNSSTRLTHIDLHGNKFNGPIPESFGSLDFLEGLWLEDNMFNEIPLSLGNLSNLRDLYLSANEFNQPLDQIFQNLSGKASKSLKYIDLSHNQLVGSLSDIAQFSSLWQLGLRNNKLSGFHPQSLARPSSLGYLDLTQNKIGGSFPDLRAYSSLQQLYLSKNQIKGMITIDHLSNLTNLYGLDLSDNSLSLNISYWNPPFQLELLFLRDCNVGPAFPKWLQTQSDLQHLDMSYNRISDDLPTWLWNISFLSYLNLSHNHISGRIHGRPSHSYGFTYIDLSNNHLSGPIPLFLFQSNGLLLSKNKFSGSIPHLCKAERNYDMYVLDLSDNQLTGELHDCWPNTISLQIVNLANNNFSGQIPPALGHMSLLQILHLRNNSFVGELPPSFKNCTGLRMIDLGGNKLTGTIPQWIGTHLTNLTVLSLRSNQFHGSIDTTICQLTAIQVLDLSRNNLSGKIPKCFNSFSSLLQKNSSIDGKFFLANIREGLFVNLVENFYADNLLVQWKGYEYEYTKLGILKGIDLSNNKLVGTIPQEFSDLVGLVFLNLSKNHLTGNIISSIGQMEMLEWLDVSRNELSGGIPNSLAELHFLSVLDLSYNNLSGKIPVGTQLQSFNSSAYAGNSQLCGPPLVECPWDSPYPSPIDRDKGNNEEEDNGLINRDFYICLAFGFITGFWMVVGTLFVKHSWRQSYFNILNKIGDQMYVTSAIYVARFKGKFLA